MSDLNSLTQAADTLKGSDLSWAYDVIDTLKDNPVAIGEFEKNLIFS